MPGNRLIRIAVRLLLLPLVFSAPSAFAQPRLPIDSNQVNVDEPPVLPAPRTLPGVTDTSEESLELIEFRGVPLIEAMRILSEQSGLKIVPSAEAAKAVVSLYLRDVSALTAVAAVAQANGLIYRQDPTTGIVRIFTVKESNRDLSAFREDQTQVFTLLYPNALSVATAIRDLFGDRVVRLTYGVNDDRVYDDLQARINRFELFQGLSQGLGFGQNNNSSVSTVGNTGSTGTGSGTGTARTSGTGGGGSSSAIINTQVGNPQNQQAQMKLDQTVQEGLTNEQVQELQTAFNSKEPVAPTLLLDLLRQKTASIYITVIRQHNQLIVRTSDPQTMAQIHDLVCRLDVPTPVVLLEVKVLNINLTDDFNSMFDFQFTNGNLVAGGFSPNPVTSGAGAGFMSGNILPPAADATSPVSRFATIAPGVANAPPANNFLFQVVSANFRARLQLLEDKNRVTALATPLLMTANNEVSQIFSGEQIPITVGFTAAQTNTGGTVATTVAPTPITNLVPVGTTLLITPNINADRTVTLRILEVNSTTIPGGGMIPVANANGNGFTNFPVDIVSESTYTGTVVAQDGLAIAVGGLIQESLNDSRSEVPFLAKIPGLGFFFRRQATQRSRTELVLVIRPFVLNTCAESTDASKKLVESLSIHPNVVKMDLSTMGTFNAPEVLRPNPPENEWQNVFRVHTVSPKDF